MSITINFSDNKAANEKFIAITVDADKVMQSWQISILALEWLLPSGKVKALNQLSPDNHSRITTCLAAIKNNEPVNKPILGLGIMDNIEIGSGRPEFIALYQSGQKHIPVHIPKSNEADFKKYLA